jgi:uncharacterized coiled-coil protein SlyX
MPDENEQKKERSKVSIRIGDAQVELEGTYDEIKKLMGKELFDFAEALQETEKKLPSPTETIPEVTPKEKNVAPPSKPSTTSAALSQPSRVSAIGKTTEKMSQKKIVSRTMVIALGIICIVLASGLVGTIATYMLMVSNLEAQVAEKNNTILSLNSQVSSSSSQVLSLNSQVSSLQADLEQINSTLSVYKDAIQDYNSQISYYLSLLSLNESTYLLAAQTLTQDANNSTTVYNYIINYAGYVSVVVNSNSTTTYVQMIYSSYGVNYDHNVTVGTNGTALFPVLPGEIEIKVGNTEPVDNVTATVTAIYSY